MRPGGALAIHNQSDSLVATAASSQWLASDIWRYVELKLDIATGECQVRCDGVPVVSGSVAAATSVGSITIPSNTGIALDDLYIADTTGSRNNDFLGDVRVNLLVPEADGTHQDMTPSSGSEHFSLVNEASPDTTSYVSTSASGAKETYSFQNLSANTGGVFGLQLTSYANKDATGTVGLRNIARVNGVDYQGTNYVGLSTSWIANTETWESNPATGAQWEAADINSAEFGVETI